MKSSDSKIYKGISRDKPGEVVPYERSVAVYVPAQYVAGTAAPFIVVQDGYNPKYHYSVPTALDNLIHQKKVPVMLAVLVHNGGGDGPGSQRGMEYDTVSDNYAMFIETEVLPRIERDYKVTLHKRSRRARDDGWQLRRGSSADDGLVSSGAVSESAELFRHVRRPGARLESRRIRSVRGNTTLR